MARYIPVADCAKLVRAAIKGRFPTTVFSVRSKSYAGGASINVRWTDGPTVPAVDEVVDPFVGSSFDGMIDLKSLVYGRLNGEEVRYGSDYIHTTRDISPAFHAFLVQKFESETGLQFVPGRELHAFYAKDGGRFWQNDRELTWADSLIYQASYHLDRCNICVEVAHA